MQLLRDCRLTVMLAAGVSLLAVPGVSFCAPGDSRSLPSLDAAVEPGAPLVAIVPAPPEAHVRTVLISIKEPTQLTPERAVTASVGLAGPGEAPASLMAKTLHAGDPDVLWAIRQPGGVPLKISVTARWHDATAFSSKPLRIAIRVAALGSGSQIGTTRAGDAPAGECVAFEAEPNDTPETADPLILGQTVYGLADDRPYLPRGDEPTELERTAGGDWFRFALDSDEAKLGFFSLDFVDRDVPPDVRIYCKENGKLVEYTRGIDPQSAQRERPPRPGANKFTTRVLTKGSYFVWVDACQPDYQLRTKLFDVPPYLKPEQADSAGPAVIATAARRAIRTAMEFQLLAGDSWHANTPRKGHPLDRIGNFHHETSTCIACHPTQFTTQSVLSAVKAGYGVEQPFALQFLTERLANNPVPLHGEPGALWARMIPAPANVLGRLSTIVMDYEDLFAGSPRDNLHRGIGEFLKLYYDGRTEIPRDETNGNNPVSRFKVATDSWRQLGLLSRRTGDPRYSSTRDLVARLLSTSAPANTRDLAAQTIGLCLIDPKRETLAGKINENVARLLALQRPSGHWSVKFDPNYPITEMQTGESLYALSLAGLKPDHPAMRSGVVALLTRQQAFGGWFDINPYEQFRTPFRETQWALIALAALYPTEHPRPKGWNNPLGTQPKRLRIESAASLIRDLERIWDAPEPGLLRSVTAALLHESPLVRYAASRTLGRVGDATSVAPLARALGDESKVVSRAAAEGLRMLGNRASGSRRPSETPEQVAVVTELRRALRSGDPRVRRGATRVFAAHFRELSQEPALLDPLLAELADPDPVVAMQAIKGCWRYWYWQADPSLRNRIEDRFIAELAEPRHPWVRRNLIEALYIIGDENIRYLYQNWVPALASAETRRRVTESQHATVNRLGAKYVTALETRNRLQREGVLRAMSEFFERPVLGGRIGNDLEPMLFYDEMADKVAEALAALGSDPDPTIRRLALQALVTVHGNRSTAAAVLRRLADPDASVRSLAATMAKKFPLDLEWGKADTQILELIDDLLGQTAPAGQAAALEIIGRLGPVPDARARFDRTEKIRSHLTHPEALVRTAALEALRSFPDLWPEKPVRTTIDRALGDPNPQARVAAIRLALEPLAMIGESRLRRALDDPAPEVQIALLERIASEPGLRNDLRLIGVLSDALVSKDGGAREKGLQLIQSHPAFLANAAVEHSLSELTRSAAAGEREREISRSLLATRGRASADAPVGERLDREYFQMKILPIFARVGEDGQSCLGCHRAHAILKLAPPSKTGEWPLAALSENYRSALRVVNLARPAESLLVNKPTWEAAEEAEAQRDPSRKAHTGGVRFEKGSSEYQTLLDWINGARLPDREQRAPR
jgi:HEAT repeat protein